MNGVFESCDQSMDSIAGNIEDSQQYFTNVSDEINDMKVKINQKGSMFEDMNNVLGQINPLIDEALK